MCRRATTTALILGLLTLLMLPLQAKPPQKGGGKTPPPAGPGLIAFSDAELGVVALINPDGTGYTPVGLSELTYTRPSWSHAFSDGTVKLAWWDQDPVTLKTRMMVANVFPEIGTPTPVPGVEIQGIFNWTEANVDWSPSVISETGTETVRLCYTEWDWSPDGSPYTDLVVVELVYDPVSGGFVVDPDATLTINTSSARDPRFSPDGTWLAFRESGQITVAKSDGSEAPKLLIDDSDDPGSFDRQFAWSPDGTKMVFASNRNGKDDSDFDLYIASLNPNMSVQSIERLRSRNIRERAPTWSPEGAQIAYHHGGNRFGMTWQDGKIGKVVLADGDHFNLFGDRKVRYPDWSPMNLPPLP